MTGIPLILKEPMDPFSNWVLVRGLPADAYPGDAAFPAAVAAHAEWERRMADSVADSGSDTGETP